MGYHILNGSGNKIASFTYECDRDICIDALREYFEDDKAFTADDE